MRKAEIRAVRRLEIAIVVERQIATGDGNARSGRVTIGVGSPELTRQRRGQWCDRTKGVARAADRAERVGTRRREVEDAVARATRREVVGNAHPAGVVIVIDDSRIAGDVAIALADRLAGVIAGEEGHVATIVAKVTAEQALDVELGAVAKFGDTILRGQLEAFEIVLEDEVDDARDGVRTVHRRRTAGDDVDPLDKAGRDGADIDHARGRGSGNALAVDQDQGALRPETTKIEGREGFAALVVRHAGVARDDLRKLVQQGFDGNRSGQVELLGSHGRDGARSL